MCLVALQLWQVRKRIRQVYLSGQQKEGRRHTSGEVLQSAVLRAVDGVSTEPCKNEGFCWSSGKEN